MILIRAFESDSDASKWANDRQAQGYDLHSVAINTVLRYDKERRREIAENTIVVTMVRPNIEAIALRESVNALRLAA